MKITIVGFGKVGSALAVELSASGNTVIAVIDKSKEKLKRVSKTINIGITSSVLNQDIVKRSDIIIISLKDDDLLNYMSKISKIDFKGRILVHTSGVLTSDVFSSLKVKKSLVASMHPAQTFNKLSISNNHLLRGIYFGMEGGSEAIRSLKMIIRGLKSKSVTFAKNKKSLYHLGCVVSSNFLAANFYLLKLFSKELCISEKKFTEIMFPLFSTTANNLFKDGVIGSLTGPVIRGDITTIKTHINLLHSKFPNFVEYYKVVSKILTEVSFKQNKHFNHKKITEILNNE